MLVVHASLTLSEKPCAVQVVLAAELRRIHALGLRVYAQTSSRVIDGKTVVLSIFEPHTDLIVQGNFMTFGHKVTLTTGASGLTLAVVVERGKSR